MKFTIFLLIAFFSLPVFATSYNGTANVTVFYTSSRYENQSYSCSDYWITIWETKRDNGAHTLHYRSDFGGCGDIPSIGGVRVQESYEIIGENLFRNNIKVGTITKNEINFNRGTAPRTLEVKILKNNNGSIIARQFFTSYDQELTVVGNLTQWQNEDFL